MEFLDRAFYFVISVNRWIKQIFNGFLRFERIKLVLKVDKINQYQVVYFNINNFAQ